mgnify:CR=1 FL=1
MKIHEYQAKEIFAAAGIPVPPGRVAESVQDVTAIAEELDRPVMVKAQVHVGGRGKAGGVVVVDAPAKVEQEAERMLANRLVTKQTGPEGKLVSRVLIEEALPIDRELYLGIVLDRSAGFPVMMASKFGGMEIEEVAAETMRGLPPGVSRVPVRRRRKRSGPDH